jgi:hypothetical protein
MDIQNLVDDFEGGIPSINSNSFASIDALEIPPPPAPPELFMKKRGRPFKEKIKNSKRKYQSLALSEFYEVKKRMDKEVYNVKHLAKIYGVSINTIRNVQKYTSPPVHQGGVTYRKINCEMAQNIAEIALNENVRSIKEINSKLKEKVPDAPIVHDSSVDRIIKSKFMIECGVPRFSFKISRKIQPQRMSDITLKERMAFVKELQVFVYLFSLFVMYCLKIVRRVEED